MRITSGGNVGIGTSNPLAALQVGNGTQTAINGASNKIHIATTGTRSALLTLANSSGAVTVEGQFESSAESADLRVIIGSTSNHDVVLRSNNAERMRITSGGKIEMGSTSVSGEIVKVTGTSSADNYISVYSGTIHMFIDADATNSSGITGTQSNHNLKLRTNGINRMNIDTSGNIGAPNSGTNIYSASDIRLKKNITTITNGLSKINALNPVKFNWIDGFVESEEGKDMLGFIAQEVQNIVPEAVESFSSNSIIVGKTTIENPLRVNEKFIIPVLVKAIQEQQCTIQCLTNRIEQLENN
jgi:hypothetical protein